MMENKEVTLIKKAYAVQDYENAIDPAFTEFVTPTAADQLPKVVTVTEFFEYYDQLFFDIPVTGETNSHTYLVQQSQQYIGGSVIDIEKQALIEEINSLRQQLLDLNQTFTSINNIV